MSTQPQPRTGPAATTAPPQAANGASAELANWRQQTRVFLQPIAAPSILGLFGFAVATFVLSAYLVGWYGGPATPLVIFPFFALWGGLLQIIASIWAFRARDGLACGFHGLWGAWWLAYGFLEFMIALKLIPAPARNAIVPALAYIDFAIGAVTILLTIAALTTNLAMATTGAALGAGAVLMGVFYLVGGYFWIHGGGYVLMLSAFLATYTAFAMVLEATAGRVILPTGALRKGANVPGGHAHFPIQFTLGEPGVKAGQ